MKTEIYDYEMFSKRIKSKYKDELEKGKHIFISEDESIKFFGKSIKIANIGHCELENGDDPENIHSNILRNLGKKGYSSRIFLENDKKFLEIWKPITDSVKSGRLNAEIYILTFFLFLCLSLVIYYFLISKDALKDFFVNFGGLTFLCIVPLFSLTIFMWKLKSKAFLLSVLLTWASIIIFITFRFFKIPIDTFEESIYISILYGFICVNSCFLGLQIKKSEYIENSFSLLRENFVLISVAVVFFIFLLDKMENPDPEARFGAFMICFSTLVLAISFLYPLYGYFSKDEYDNPNPLIFFIVSSLSFTIGLTFSVFILEFGRKMIDGLMPSHWPFICIWGTFIAFTCVILSQDTYEISTAIQKLIESFLGIDENSQ